MTEWNHISDDVTRDAPPISFAFHSKLTFQLKSRLSSIPATDPCTTDPRRSTTINSVSFRTARTAGCFRWAHGPPTRTSESPEKSTRSSPRGHQSTARRTIGWRAIGELIMRELRVHSTETFLRFQTEKLRFASRPWEVPHPLPAWHRVRLEAPKRRY